MAPHYKRIITHTDFDGLISAFLLREIFAVEEILFSEPWILQKGEFDARTGDIIVDLPYDTRCSLWIDHHKSNADNAEDIKKSAPQKVVFDATKKSCPALIYEQFHTEHAFLDGEDIKAMIAAADKIDSASFSLEDLKQPDAWGYISMSLKSDDKRKDDQYRMLVLNLLSFQSPERLLEQPVIKMRIKKKKEEQDKWNEHIHKYAHLEYDGSIVVVDLTEADEAMGDAPPFMIYTKYPDVLVSITINTIKTDDARVKMSVGKNIFKREEKKPSLDIGALVQARGGGGHADVGGCSCLKEEKSAFVTALLLDIKNAL